MPMSWPLAVFTCVLVSETLSNKPKAKAVQVSTFMQLTLAPVSNKHEKHITTSINFKRSASSPALIDEKTPSLAGPGVFKYVLGVVSLA